MVMTHRILAAAAACYLILKLCFFGKDEVTLVCSGAYGANEDLGIQDFRGSNSILLPIQAMPNL